MGVKPCSARGRYRECGGGKWIIERTGRGISLIEGPESQSRAQFGRRPGGNCHRAPAAGSRSASPNSVLHNVIESAFSIVEAVCRNVQGRRSGDQIERWVGIAATGYRTAVSAKSSAITTFRCCSLHWPMLSLTNLIGKGAAVA
jgi:hypothetical protein